MTLEDDYRIGKPISEGGFGRIYEARHRLLDEPACVKMNKEAYPDDVELLRTEARLLWRLDDYHSIPAAKGFYQMDSLHAALAMKYISGESLDQLVAGKGRIHPEDASWIVERLLGALYYAHSHGVVHADVKPQNVMVEAKKHDIKLIDWGLSIYRPTSSTRPIGSTAAYAAPEILDKQPPIPESDLYGAGMVLLAALGGDIHAKAFPADTPEQLAEFGKRLLCYDPIDRPNWEKVNLIEELSNIRQAVFGRRHTA